MRRPYPVPLLLCFRPWGIASIWKMPMPPPASSGPERPPAARTPHRLREVVLPAMLVVGDAVCAVGGLIAGYGMRYHTPIADLGVPVPGASLALYLPLLLLGALMLMGTFVYLDLYDPRLLLRRVYGLGLIIKGMIFWLAAYLGVSLVLQFNPPISRLFVLVAFGTTLVTIYAWRNLFYFAITRTALLAQVKQRLAVLGCDARARAFFDEIAGDRVHTFGAAGFIGAPGEARPDDLPASSWLGSFDELDDLLARHNIDVLVVGGLDLPRESFTRLIEACERNYTAWKVIPSAFDLFVSNLQLESHGGVPVLGVGSLAIRRLFNRAAKRACDLLGAGLGLVVALPVMVVAALLVRREAPGPALFRQTRIGTNHRPFTMYKLRTMRVGAETEDNARQSTTADDPRVLRIGRILRRWNVDELPQFWNILVGDMSLVGPRPERPYHVDTLARRIAHYLPRHLVKPGLTGWAQINGCRGAGDLERRVQLDIYYIENWSLALDAQIMALTVLRWRNPSE